MPAVFSLGFPRVVQEIVSKVDAKATDTRTQSKAHCVSIDNCGTSFLTPQEIPAQSASAFSERQRGRDMCLSASNPRRQTSTTQGYKTWHGMTNVSFLVKNMLKNSSTLAVSVPINLSITLGFVYANGL